MINKPLSNCNTCKNKFHKSCINIWLKSKGNCPLCRSKWKIEAINIENQDSLLHFNKFVIKQ